MFREYFEGLVGARMNDLNLMQREMKRARKQK